MKVKKYFNHIKLFLQNNEQYKGGTHRIRYNKKLFLNFLLKGLFVKSFTVTFSDSPTSLFSRFHVPNDEYLLELVLTKNKLYITEKKYHHKKTIFKIASAM